MRKIYLAIITASLLGYSANAQIKKGSIFLGGDISGSTQKTKTGGITTNKQNGITISPVFGKAIKDNLVLGMNVGFSIYEMDNSNGSPYDYNADFYNAGIFLRKYKNIGAGGFYLFVQGGLGGSYLKQKQEDSNSGFFDQTKRVAVGLTAYPGISYAVSKKLHLETGFNNLLSLNYFNEKRNAGSPVTTSKTNGFNIASSLNNATSSLYLGFRLLIGK
jgi:hypothetical protein